MPLRRAVQGLPLVALIGLVSPLVDVKAGGYSPRVDNAWQVETVAKELRRTILARQLIDWTGGADVVGMVGLPRFRESQTQPGTLRFFGCSRGWQRGRIGSTVHDSRNRPLAGEQKQISLLRPEAQQRTVLQTQV